MDTPNPIFEVVMEGRLSGKPRATLLDLRTVAAIQPQPREALAFDPFPVQLRALVQGQWHALFFVDLAAAEALTARWLRVCNGGRPGDDWEPPPPRPPPPNPPGGPRPPASPAAVALPRPWVNASSEDRALKQIPAAHLRRSPLEAGPLQVLVVDDDVPIQKALLAFLRGEGLRGEAVSDGASALAVVELRQPEVVLLDTLMPVMDGFEFMERLRTRTTGRPKVIVVSAAERLDLVQARMGADACIPQPFDPERLRAALRRFVRPATREDALAT